MPFYTSTTGANALLPDEYGPLVVQPALDASVFAQVATTVTTGATEYRIPIVSADPTAAWVAEGAEITPSDPTLQELTVTPPKLTVVELENPFPMIVTSSPPFPVLLSIAVAVRLGFVVSPSSTDTDFCGLASLPWPGLVKKALAMSVSFSAACWLNIPTSPATAMMKSDWLLPVALSTNPATISRLKIVAIADPMKGRVKYIGSQLHFNSRWPAYQ